MAEVQANTASAKESKSAGENTPGSGAGKKSAKSKAAIYIVAVLAVAAAGGYFWLRPGAANSAAASAAAPETTLPLETFVVNLDGTGQRAYLRVGITLGISRPPGHGKKEEAPVALVRDAILSVLSSARPEQLLTSDGKQKLKADLLKALQERAPELGVQNVYFTEFLVQM